MTDRARSAALILLAGYLLAVPLGCAREPKETREIRLAVERYLDSLAHKNLDEIRRRSTCVVAIQSVEGGNVLRIGPTRRILVSSLDSLAMAASLSHRRADSLMVHAPTDNRETLLADSRRAARLQVTYRNAIRALPLSKPDVLHDSGTALELCAVRARVRYGGELVGPRPVDREMVVRLLRAPQGSWIVFSFFTAEDDPNPDGV